ncbi:MAG: hypothetical protein WA030_04105 [Candidatus Microsaccharimonas sp.]
MDPLEKTENRLPQVSYVPPNSGIVKNVTSNFSSCFLDFSDNKLTLFEADHNEDSLDSGKPYIGDTILEIGFDKIQKVSGGQSTLGIYVDNQRHLFRFITTGYIDIMESPRPNIEYEKKYIIPIVDAMRASGVEVKYRGTKALFFLALAMIAGGCLIIMIILPIYVIYFK